MHAILKLDIPKSCAECELNVICEAFLRYTDEYRGYEGKRHPRCPLTIVMDGDGWIPVEAELPDPGLPVLAIFGPAPYKWYSIMRRKGYPDDDEWCEPYGWEDYAGSEPNPSHWRYLPDLPDGMSLPWNHKEERDYDRPPC